MNDDSPTADGEGPRILVTNDDGIQSPGLAALAQAMAPLGRVVVVAPDRERSAAGHALTIHRPLRLHRAADPEGDAAASAGVERWHVDGTPADCVHLAVPRLTGGRPPDLVVSGINRGLNVGDDVTYSGTVAGALEGALLHVPALAFSAEIGAAGQIDWGRCVPFARALAAGVLERGLPAGILLNVNFPAGRPRGVRWTRQGTRRYRATSIERRDPAGRPYFWIDQIDMTPTGESDGDHRAIDEGCVSVTPLHANRTHAATLEALRDWDLSGATDGA